jgi:hypothetical protein
MMPKNFKKLPNLVTLKIEEIQGDVIEVRSVQVLSGEKLAGFSQLNINISEVCVAASWVIEPHALEGRTSVKNAEGWTVKRTDLPKYSKTFCHDAPKYGDPRRGWSTICRDIEVYHKDTFLPRNHEVVVTVDEQLPDGNFGVKFTLSDCFDKTSPSFEEDLLFGINLLQENFGGAEVSAPDAPGHYFTEVLDWELFLPGSVEAVLSALNVAGRLTNPDEVAVARTRLKLFEKYEPENYIKGMSGNDTYIGAKYADDLVVFESTKYGNAMYLLYVDWEDLSTRPRSELLKMAGNEVDRIVHHGAWENEFRGLLGKKLRARGRSFRMRR